MTAALAEWRAREARQAELQARWEAAAPGSPELAAVLAALRAEGLPLILDCCGIPQASWLGGQEACINCGGEI